jgi:hypothetical protein
MGRKDFKVPKRVSTGLLKKGSLTFDMDLLAFKAALSKRRTITLPPEPMTSGRLKISNPWPLSYAPVIGIADSISNVY